MNDTTRPVQHVHAWIGTDRHAHNFNDWHSPDWRSMLRTLKIEAEALEARGEKIQEIGLEVLT